tara:strand:- start:417 stop:1277 length:861 start_codon:yes stop_codon:yes gene_type:complete
VVEIAELSFVAFSITLLIVIFLLRRHFAMTPSNDRSWVNDNQRLASVEITGDKAHIKNVRDFSWRTTKDYDERWIDMTIDLNKVRKIWFILEYFSPERKEMAHTILSYEFDDGRRLACSIEVRRKEGSRFHPLKGMFRSYELIYVWGTESDIIGVRSRCRRKSKTHLFEGVVLGPGNERRMLESYLRRTNKLAKDPEWYNTITNTCTTNIVNHVNEVYPGRVPWAIGILMPGLSPKMLLRNNLVKSSGNIDETMESSLIDSISEKWDDSRDFGDWIRGMDTRIQHE